jgi:hypothetical protein
VLMFSQLASKVALSIFLTGPSYCRSRDERVSRLRLRRAELF